MKRAACLLAALALTSCYTSPNVPQRTFQWSHTLESVGLTTRDDMMKNAAARRFARALVSETNPSLVSSITVDNPQGRDFSRIVKEFSDRIAVPYTKKDANLVISFGLERVDGAFKGRGIRNNEMVISVLRPGALYGGDQIIAMRSVRFRCRTDMDAGHVASCTLMEQLVAEGLLYELAESYRS